MKKEETRKGNEGMKKVGRKVKWFNVLLKSHHPSKMKTDSSRVRVDFETKSKEWRELIKRKEEDGGEWDRERKDRKKMGKAVRLIETVPVLF